MAKIYRADIDVELIEPVNGTDFKAEELNKIVGGHFEVLFGEDCLCVINEEGKLLGLPYNERATIFCHSHKLISPGDYICGDMLICDKNQIK